MTPKLAALLNALDDLPERPDLTRLTALLERSGISCDDVADLIRFSDQAYAKNTLKATDHYHAWILCWKNGQRSPIHDHRGSCCAVRVLRGTLTQTYFEFAPNGHVKAIGSKDFPAGSVIASRDMDLHQVSNLQAGSADLVTLHVYAPPLPVMGTYSLTDLSRGEETWDEERRFVTSFPENSETPIENVHGWVTPNRLFFVRNHFNVPDLDRSAWRLRVEGCVERPLELTWSELTSLPARSVFATVECAGNGRSFLHKPAPGVQWGAGAIGHAEWTGVPLRLVLEKAGLRPDAVEVVFEGADIGSESDHPDPMHFARGLPIPKALDPDTLLAYRMNGEPLKPNHGYPVRLFVPGWYGVASVKWLQRIQVLDHAFRGYFQTKKYTVQRRSERGEETVVVGPMAVKAELIRPQHGATLGLGMNRLFGVAWVGEEAVAGVDVSVDGGATWAPADLLGPRAPYSWTLWEYLWEVSEPGPYELLARATSSAGHVQPMRHDLLNGGYVIHFCRPRAVQVVESRRAPVADDMLVYDMNAFAEANSQLPLDVEMEFTWGEGI